MGQFNKRLPPLPSPTRTIRSLSHFVRMKNVTVRNHNIGNEISNCKELAQSVKLKLSLKLKK